MLTRRSIGWVPLAGALAAAAGSACAATGISIERAGLGLKPAGAPTSWLGRFTARDELSIAWHATETGEIAYSGVREAARLGVRTPESYGGYYHPLSDTWSAMLELGAIQASPLAPRRYSLLGQFRTEFAGGGLSIGLKYRVYEPDSSMQSGAPGELTPANGFALVPMRPPSSYQLQLSYQYSPATTFGFVLGRDLETYTPGFDQPGAGPRQFTFTGQHWLSPSWALSYDLLSNDPGNLFRLQGLRFGMRYLF